MCTAVTYQTQDHYFGRNLDLEVSLGEEIVVMPRRFPLGFRNGTMLKRHYAVIGVAWVRDGYPLYYDAVNEKGLWMAGLNFPESAVYQKEEVGEGDIAPFEFIPWVLAQCESVKDAEGQLRNIRLVKEDFSLELPATPLHWMIADRIGSIVAEPLGEGLRIYENPTGILTNEPPFPVQLAMLRNYVNLTAEETESRFAEKLELNPYSRGIGAMGLPGDISSSSRFVRAAFTKWNSVSGAAEAESVGQFFHILDTVAQCNGCCRLKQNVYEKTIYSSCCNADKGIYYYTTYENRQIIAVDLYREQLEGKTLVSYPMVRSERFAVQNKNAK